MSRNFFEQLDAEEEIKLIPAPKISHVLNLGIDWERRLYHMHGEVVESDGESFWAFAEYYREEPIFLHLSTPGGDVDAMFEIHDAIRRHGNVTVTGYGQVCSAGVLILAAGHHRQVTESTMFMSHESTGSPGELGYRASKDRRKADDWQHLWWCELMARYTPNDKAWWKSTTHRQAEYWLLGGEAIVEAGIADEVVGR